MIARLVDPASSYLESTSPHGRLPLMNESARPVALEHVTGPRMTLPAATVPSSIAHQLARLAGDAVSTREERTYEMRDGTVRVRVVPFWNGTAVLEVRLDSRNRSRFRYRRSRLSRMSTARRRMDVRERVLEALLESGWIGG